MARDRLIVLKVDFEDLAYPGLRFYCEHCVLMEGVLAMFPELADHIDVERIAWPRPRQRLVDLLDLGSQSLPILILADDAPLGLETGKANGRRFVEGKSAILKALTARHGIPVPHP